MQRTNRIFFIIFCLGLFFQSHLLAQEANPYVIRDVEATASSKNASEARAKAMNGAEKAAFAKFLEQSGHDPILADSADPAQISAAVEGFEVVSEKVGSKSYSIITHITFNPDLLQEAIDGAYHKKSEQDKPAQSTGWENEAVPPSSPNVQGQGVIIVPILRDYGSAVLWEESNGWRDYWNRHAANNGEIRAIIPLGDINDMSAVDVARISRLDDAALKYLANRYRSSNIVIADAARRFMPNGMNMDVILQPLAVTSGGHQLMQQNNFSLSGAANETELFQRAIDEAVKRLSAAMPSQQENYQQAEQPAIAGQEAKLVIPLGHISEWVRIRKMLEGTPYVTDVRMLAISPSQADVMIRFNCSQQQMISALSQSGNSLQPQGDYWILGSANKQW